MIVWHVVIIMCMGATQTPECESHSVKVYDKPLIPANCFMEGQLLAAKQYRDDGWTLRKISCYREK